MSKIPCPYLPEFIEARKADLLNRKKQTLEQLKSISHKNVAENDAFDADFPNYGDKEDDNATEVADYAGNLSMEEILKTTLEMIDKALNKIELGTYGIDEKTGEWINPERLIVMPTATKNTHG
jgi:RNA polymerase-binding transcription factor DksA